MTARECCYNCRHYNALDSYCNALHTGVQHPHGSRCENFREGLSWL